MVGPAKINFVVAELARVRENPVLVVDTRAFYPLVPSAVPNLAFS